MEKVRTISKSDLQNPLTLPNSLAETTLDDIKSTDEHFYPKLCNIQSQKSHIVVNSIHSSQCSESNLKLSFRIMIRLKFKIYIITNSGIINIRMLYCTNKQCNSYKNVENWADATNVNHCHHQFQFI